MAKQGDNTMDIIWENLNKSPDADHITMEKGDIEVLWHSGFVDAESVSLDKWVKLFEPHKRGSGDGAKYVLNKKDFLEKDNYRFKGEIKVPFEPFYINEGKYSDEGLQDLIDNSVTPSMSKSKKEIREFFDDLKARYRDKKDSLIDIRMPAKREIAIFINQNPSPLRRLEMMFYATFVTEVAKFKPEDVRATRAQAAKVHMSTFSTLPSSTTEKAAIQLKGVTKAKEKKSTISSDEGVMLRKVKKSRKGMRG